MGTKYSSVTVSGYNASPPSDLSSDTATTNKVTWQKHLDKIGGPVKTALEAINSALVTFCNFGSRVITTTDSVVASDHMKTVEVSSTVTVTFTLTLADAATMAAGFIVHIRNSSAVDITIGRATGGDTINGTAANVTLRAGALVTYKVNAGATGYFEVHKNDYVEGTWTPAVTFGGGATGLTYTTQTGTYTRIGNRVIVDAVIVLSAKGSSTGTAIISGLPFTVAAATPATIRITTLGAAIDAVPGAVFTASATTIALEQLGNAATAVAVLDEGDFANTTSIHISGQYRIA